MKMLNPKNGSLEDDVAFQLCVYWFHVKFPGCIGFVHSQRYFVLIFDCCVPAGICSLFPVFGHQTRVSLHYFF